MNKIEAIQEDIRRKVSEGILGSGVMLPGRRDLAREYNVAIGTVERAISRLVTEGLLRADEGRGTFVAGSELATETRRLNGVSETTMRVTSATQAVLGIVTAYDTDYRVLTVTQSLERVFSASGGATVFYTQLRPEGFQPLPDSLQTLIAQGVDAVVIVGVNDRPVAIEPVETMIRQSSLPILYISGTEIARFVPNVYYDNRDAGYQAMQHLIERGHQAVVFLAPFTAPWVEARWQGAILAWQHAGLPVARLVRWSPSPTETAWGVDQRLAGQRAGAAFIAGLASPPPGIPAITGVIGTNDLVALGFLDEVTKHRELNPPFSVLGFDDTEDARRQGLTSLRPPLEAMGEEAARQIMNALRGSELPLQVRLRSHLVVRASTYTGRGQTFLPNHPS